ncbi:copper chaperone PCu(A)C [Shewanella salipaludis]|uniref:Copper chaperone PCu(A)C n=1 Tax=Shewanella salipaludis TaxID=2723052 RepID=A0A972JNS1_9GAMM|nr:copper chaperone PCu(A)C [Shewanella salipaludis]NMH66441.1 copper chaperone PCu(A)C [Shewanella salipaludis]
MRFRLLGLGLLCLSSLGVNASELMVHNAWIRAMPPSSRVVPVYLTLHNPGNTELILTGIRSPRGRIALHQSMMHNDMMRMQPVAQISIPAHAVVKLAPAGLHGMMSNFSSGVPAEGDTVPLTLILAQGEPLKVTAEVLNLGEQAEHDMHQQH